MAYELVAEPRAELGKEKCSKLRAANRLPGNVYGAPLTEARAISFDLHATELLVKQHGKSAEYTLSLEGASYPVRIEEIHFDPLTKSFEHLDLVVRNNG
jgi:ribosomal protein L25 (general stress protein Ctc)